MGSFIIHKFLNKNYSNFVWKRFFSYNFSLSDNKYNHEYIDVCNIYNDSCNDIYNNKKLISISPGGFKGFYLLGTLIYIKENYDLKNYIFSGASAGAWCSLIMSMKSKFDLLDFIDENITNSKSILEIEQNIKIKIMKKYNNDDFDFKRIYVGVTQLKNLNVNTIIYSNFKNLEDAIDCCIASSHIPFVTGGLLNKYHNKISFDGGFVAYPYIKEIKATLHVDPYIWNSKKTKSLFSYDTTLFSKDKYNFKNLYLDGYNDAKKNKDYLNSVFDK